MRLTATQKITCGATTTTLALAVLLARVVSGRSPMTTTVLVIVPGALGVVTRVIVTVAFAAIGPMSQVSVVPPRVQVPCVELAETNVFPPGIGSETLTPVSLSGPLLVTTIVQVMFPSPSCRAGDPDLVIDRSTWKAHDSSAEAGGGLEPLPTVSVAVLS